MRCFGVKTLSDTFFSPPLMKPGFWRVHGLTRSTHAEIRYLHTWKSVNLAWAVRISGDGGQEGRHLAKKKKKGYGTRHQTAGFANPCGDGCEYHPEIYLPDLTPRPHRPRRAQSRLALVVG